MKTIIWNKSNCKKYTHSKGTINISISGRISFNNRALEILGFTEKSKFLFIQDSDNNKNWYIQLTTKPEGFSITVKSKNRWTAFFNRSLAIQILQSLNAGQSTKFIISPHLFEEKYYPIITHSKEEKNG